MIFQDPDWEIRRIFRDTSVLVIYRALEADTETLNLKSFFEDYYQVFLVTGSETVPDCDLLHLSGDGPEQLSCQWIWQEQEKVSVSGNKVTGPIKKTYIRLFLDSCSA